MDEIRAAIKDMKAAEQLLLEERSRDLASATA